MKRMLALAAAAATVATLASGPALAADHEVKMLTRGSTGMMVFEPAYLEVAPGDTVHFVATDPSHNAETIPGVVPEGAEPFKGAMNKSVSVTFETEGVYGYRCKPHFAMGMVGVVVVGEDAANLDTAKAAKYPGKAKKVMADLLSQVEKKVAAVE